MLIHLKTLS